MREGGNEMRWKRYLSEEMRWKRHLLEDKEEMVKRLLDGMVRKVGVHIDRFRE